MQTKSNIQIIAEVLQAKAEFFGTLRNVLEKYDIEDNADNEYTMDIIYNEWGNWIQTNKADK